LKVKAQLYPHTISACGCLFYRKQTQELLLISYVDPGWPNYDDFGGTIDKNDETVNETIWREVAEETNGVISENDIKKILKSKKYVKFYNEFCKYYFIAVNVDSNFHQETEEFGDLEETDKLPRTINWIKYDKALPKLATRLKNCAELINFLNTEFEIKSTPKKGFPMGF
jgi:ADP-ribose pyrophosphatase YjhB (NUDIX family)